MTAADDSAKRIQRNDEMPSSLANTIMRTAVLVGALVFFGCAGEEIVTARDEREAIRYLALLAQHGVPAEKETLNRNGKDLLVITVRAEDRVRAFELLTEYGLPEEVAAESSDQSVSSFLPPTPEEAARREMKTKTAEVVRLLELLPGVLNSGLTVVPASQAGEPTRLLLVLRLLPNARVAEVEEASKNIISQSFAQPYELSTSIPRPRRNTSDEQQHEELVELFFPFPFHVPVSEVRNVQLQIYSLFGFGVVLSIIVGWFVGADVMRRRLLSGRVPKGTFERLQEIARQAEAQSRKLKDRPRAATGIPISPADHRTDGESQINGEE